MLAMTGYPFSDGPAIPAEAAGIASWYEPPSLFWSAGTAGDGPIHDMEILFLC